LFTFACSNDKKSGDENNSQQNEVNTEEVVEEQTQDTENIDEEAIEKYDFRKANWGMSMEEVKTSEGKEPELESENTLDYSTIILGMQTQIGYTFNNNELIRGGFFFITKPETNNGYIEKYEEIKEELVKVNGKPVIDTEQALDPYQTFTPEEKGDAVCNGDLLYATQWDLPNTDIQLVLRGANNECMLTILYQSEESLRQLIKERTKTE
jgi:hypothetical protein